jgi:putative addiction module component (TIGR02574 family)
MKLAKLPQLLALSPAEKLDLIEELWDSMESDFGQLDLSEEKKKLLDDRWERFLTNPDSALTLNQVKAFMAARRK